MTSYQLDEERIFHVARKQPDKETQAEYLDQICAGDQALRERVEALLKVHEQEQEFLNSNDVVEPTADHSRVTESSGQRIGRYKLLQKIGEGGFGIVYMAEQSRPVRRKVALKIIKPGMDTHAVVARFEAERQALAMMDHAHIARVLDGGATESGRPYFVMELVKGVPITTYCDKNELPTDERLRLFVTVCQAVQHAHQKGIIHRDLKPSNILVTLQDGEPMVKVIDFGIAKAINQQLTEKTLFTAFGQLVGTPQYMSPEQAEMSGLDVDTRSDIYSLGVILYELLTGTTPLEVERLRAAGYAEMQRLIREEEPPKPSTRLSTSGDKLTVIAKHRSLSPEQLQKAVRGDLDWIVMKALEKDRARRYETPSALVDDVERFADDRPVQACPPSASYRLRKFVRRNKTRLAVASFLLTCLLVAAIGANVAALRYRTLARNYATVAHQKTLALAGESLAKHAAEEAGKKLAERTYRAEIQLAEASFFEGNAERTVDLLQQLQPLAGQTDHRDFEWYYLWNEVQRGRNSRALEFPEGRLMAGVFSPDGTKFAAATWDKFGIVIWKVATGETLRLLDVATNVMWVDFSPDSALVVAGGQRGHISCWDLRTGERIFTDRPSSGEISRVRFSPDGRYIAAAGRKLWIYDVAGQGLHDMFRTSSPCRCLDFSHDGQEIAAGQEDGTILRWHFPSGEMLGQFKAHHGTVGDVRYCPLGGELASCGYRDGLITRWDLSDMTGETIVSGHTREVNSLAYSKHGNRLVTASSDCSAIVWDLPKGKRLATLRGHSEAVRNADFSPDGKTVSTTSPDGAVKLWRLEQPKSLLPHDCDVRCLAFAPDGTSIATGGADGVVRIWSVASGQEIRELAHGDAPIQQVEFSPDGSRIASGSLGDGVKIFNFATGDVHKALGERDHVLGMAFAHGGRKLICGLSNSLVKIWDVDSAECDVRKQPHSRSVFDVSASRDGKWLATCSLDKTLGLWKAKPLTIERAFDLSFEVRSSSFSSDSRLLAATGGSDLSINIWRVPTGELLRNLRGHARFVSAVAFSPDSRRLASASHDYAIKLWDVSTGEEAFTLRGHSDWVWDVAFSPDGQTLASCGRDGARIWRAPRSESGQQKASANP